MAWTYATALSLTDATPVSTDVASGGVAHFTNLKGSLCERLKDTMYGFTAGEDTDTLKGNKLTRYMVQAADPTAVANAILLYGKDASAKTELFCIDEDGHVIQITSAGSLAVDAVRRSAIRAYRTTSDQIIGDSTFTKVQFNEESFDVLSEYDKTTNFRFTAISSGYYFVCANVMFKTGSLTDQTEINFYVNGSPVLVSRRMAIHASETFSASDVLYLTAGQYVEVYAFSSTGNEIIAGNNYSNFAVHGLH